MSSFDEIRSGLLKKYNVNATGKTGSTNKQSGSTQGTPPQTDATDFQTIRRNLLDKYSVEKTTERQKTVASWGTRFNSTMERISNLSSKSGSQRTRKNIDGLDSDINSLIRSYDTISKYADRMGIPNAQRYLKQLQEAQRQIKEFKSQFKSDDEWNWYEKYNGQNSDSLQSVLDTLDDGDEKNWLQGYTNQVYNEELPTVDVEASRKKAASLQQLLDAYRQNSRFGTDAKGEAWLQEIREQYGGEEGLERAISRENRRANLAAREQDRIRNADRFGNVTRNSDFAQKSAYDPGNTDIGYRYVNGDDWERYLLEKQHGQYVEEFGYHAFDSLTDEEKAVYNYYMNTGDRQSAADYLKHIQDPLNRRKGQQIFEDGFKGNAGLEFVYGIDAGLDQFRSGVEGMGKMMRGDNTQSAPSATQYASSAMREDLGQSGKKLPSWLGGGTIGQAVYDSVTTTANMVPSILTSAALGLLNPTLGTVAGGAMMGAGAAGSAYQEMIDSGYTVGQARTYGALVGTAEMVMEKLLGGIGKLGGNSPVAKAIATWAGNVDNALVNLVGRIGGNAISEGMEEGIQEVFSEFLESQITKEDFYFEPADVIYSSLLGAFTGAIFEAPEAAIKVGTQVKDGHDILKAKGVDSLTQLGRGSENADIQRLAERAANKPSAYNVGGLKAAVSDEVHSQNARDIADSLTRKGMPQKAAQQYGEMISSMLEIGSDTELQRMVMESDPTVGKTLQEIQMPTSSVYQRMTRMDEATGKAPSIDRVAAAYGSQAEDVKNIYRLGETEPGKNLSVADFSYGFQRVFTLGREGAKESALTGEIAPGLTQDQIKYAYKLGAEAAAAEIAADKKRRGDNSSVRMLYQDGSVGSEVKITGIASMDGDETVYRLSNGTTVGEDKLSFEGDNPVLDAVRDLGLDLDAANVLIRDRNTLPVKDAVVAQGIDDAFRYGSYGYSLDRLVKDSEAAAALTEQMRKAVYNAGRNSPGKELKKPPATKAMTRGKKPGVYFDGGNGRVEAYDGSELGKDGKRKAGVQTALVLQKLGIGGDFYFFESYVNEDGERVYLDEKGVEQKAPNGWYDPADGSIHIDLNAGNDGQGLTLYTLSHELTHFIEQWSPEKYRVLADFLIKNYEKDRSVDELVQIKQATLSAERGEAVSYEEAYSEVIANSMEAMLADGNVMQKLAELKKQDVQLVGKIKNFFDNLVRNITRYYKSLTPESNEGKLVLEMKDQFEQLQRLFAEALVDAGENYRGGHSNFPVAQGIVDEFVKEYKDSHKGVQYSMRDINIDRVFIDYGDSAAEKDAIDQTVASLVSRGKLIKINTEAVNKHSTNISVDNRHDTRVYLKGILRKFTKDSVYFIYNDQYAEAYLTKDGLNHAAGGVITAERVEIFNQFKELVKNAEYAFSSKNDPHSNANKKIGGRIDWDCFVAVAMVGEKRYPVVFKIRTIDYDVRSQIYEMATKKETDGSHDPGQQNERLHGMSDYGVVPSISDDKLTQPDSEVKKFSDRDTQSLSNRSLLTAVDDSTLKHDLEREGVEKYREQIANVEPQEAKLAQLRAQIREISFAKGPRDMKLLSSLKEEATKTANRIDVYNQRLLALEATPALQKVLAREKRKANQKADDESRATLERYKQEVQAAWNGQKSDAEIMEQEFIRLMKDYHKSIAKAKDQSEQLKTYKKDMALMEKEFVRLMQSSEKAQKETNAFWEKEFNRLMREYDAAGRNIERLEAKIQAQRDSAKQKVESRHRTELRNKIRKDIRELSKILNNGNKKRNVKQGMQDFVSKAIASGEILFADLGSDEDLIAAGIQCDMSDQERALLAEAERYLRMVEELDGKDGMSEVRQLREKSLSKILKELRPVLERERSRINSADASVAFNSLVESYESLKDSEYSYIADAFNQDVLEYLQGLKSKFIGTLVKDMSQDQLQMLHKAYKMVLTTIRNANRLFGQLQTVTAAEMTKEACEQMRSNGISTKDPVKPLKDISAKVNYFSWQNLRPVDAFRRLGSEKMMQLFQGLVDGMEKRGLMTREIRDYLIKARKDTNYSKFDLRKADTYTTVDGKQMRLTLSEKMSIYAYSKRDAAFDHMTEGGFTYAKAQSYVDDDGVTRYHNNAGGTWKLALEDLQNICASLTENQRRYVDVMQKFLTEFGQRGNTVSRTLFGIDLFVEQNYFPLMSNHDYLNSVQTDLGATQTAASLKNSGFTKNTKPGANNPIVLKGFDDVCLEHLDKMMNYISLTLPLENLRKVYDNITSAGPDTDPQSTKALISAVYGEEAKQYFDQFLKDANGTHGSTGAKNPLAKMFSRSKATAVSANFSVVIQQISAVLRASAEISPMHLIAARGYGKGTTRGRQSYEEMMTYSGLANIKDMGGFDVGSTAGLSDYIGLEETPNSVEKTWKEIQDVFGMGAEFMDKVGWTMIWNAVKREVASRKQYDINSESFYQACAQRFSEIVVKTQVFDSVLSRSGFMRSDNDGVKYLTSFMGEPTVTAGMVFVSHTEVLRAIKAKKDVSYHVSKLIRTDTALVATLLLNGMLKAIPYAMRDEDEDESFWERWAKHLGSNLRGDLNPLNLLPLMRDIISIIQGRTVERPDLALLADLIAAGQNVAEALIDDEKREELKAEDYWILAEDLLGAMGNMAGVPVRNIWRDAESYLRLWKDATDSIETVELRESFMRGLANDKETKLEGIYDAVISGDETRLDALKATYKTEDSYNTAVRKSLREYDSRILQAAQAHFAGDFLGYERLLDEIEGEGNFSYRNIKGAIDSEIRKLEEEAKGDSGETASDSKDPDVFTGEDYYISLRDGNKKAAEHIYAYLFQNEIDEGYLRHQAKSNVQSALTSRIKSAYMDKEIVRKNALKLLADHAGKGETEIKKWDFEMDTGFSWGARARGYYLKKIPEKDLVVAVMDIEGEDMETAVAYIDFLDLAKANEDISITASQAAAYFEYGKSADIEVNTWMDYQERTAGIVNDVDENGESISYSAVQKKMAVINSLPISPEQKTAIAKSENWSEKTFNRYKLW